ncbi:hypothetical protein Ancab_014964 [Ancistrocladus abbreviatus]
MATGWVKSLQCRSRAFEDFYHPNAKALLPTANCRKGVQNIKDVIDTAKTKPKPKNPDPTSLHHQDHRRKHRQQPPPPPAPISRHPKPNKPKSSQPVSNKVQVQHSKSARPEKGPDTFFHSLSELPEGHPSRNVVEIIFHTRWGSKTFPGRVEIVFKIQNVAKTVTRFEEYREVVKSRAESGSPSGSGDDGCTKFEVSSARCVADGNEMMRFRCIGPTSVVMNDDGGICAINGGKGSTGTTICTFSGSGEAHDNAGGGKGRRAMLVCRVIAGRVGKRAGLDAFCHSRVGFDSVSGDNGELLVFDSRAVLPCFLVIYKL